VCVDAVGVAGVADGRGRGRGGRWPWLLVIGPAVLVLVRLEPHPWSSCRGWPSLLMVEVVVWCGDSCLLGGMVVAPKTHIRRLVLKNTKIKKKKLTLGPFRRRLSPSRVNYNLYI
jgi:hypothetical protein